MQSRSQIITVLFCLGSLVLVGNLFDHQIINTSYRTQAQSRTLIKRTIEAPRGLIYDRHDELIVVNEPNYELQMIHREIPSDLDTMEFCSLLGISVSEYEDLMKTAKSKAFYRPYIPITLINNIESEDMARFQEHLFRFPGFYPRPKNKRGYPHASAAHALGYVSEVSTRDIERSGDIYSLGDIKGASGLELIYEEDLRGDKGVEYILKDNVGREVDKFSEGEHNDDAHSGANLTTTLDIDLQAFGESLMANKRGGIVAIQPNTGEILSIISTPTYDPNKLSLGKSRNATFLEMMMDTVDQPFLDRAVMSKYPPGSIFKPILSLIAMQNGVWYPKKPMTCTGQYEVNKRKGFVQGCRDHPRPKDVATALQWSCNTYYYQMVRDYIEKYGYNQPGKGLDELMEHLGRFGLGHKLGVDLHQESPGFIPSSTFYDKRINTRDYSWKASYVLSLGIGQGELELTTLQMANLAAILANRGFYITPHMVKKINGKETIGLQYVEKNSVGIDSMYFPEVIHGMELVVNAGTARRAQVPGISVCGKTGTSQNAGKDHSVFFGFAPKENPQIAIAVFVENAGGGSTVAAPIASLMIEQYLKDSIAPNRQYLKEYVDNIDLLNVL